MIFTPTPLSGGFVIEPTRIEDERGFFARAWCQHEFATYGLNTELVQCNISFNLRRGTVRGMHYQAAPHAEAKLVRCTSGALYDVIIDLRPDAPTFMQHFSIVLSAAQHTMLYVPEGFAHGFQTLEPNTEVFYQMSTFYAPEAARGVRWNDPAFAIRWPLTDVTIGERDRTYPDFVGAMEAMHDQR